MAKTRLTGEKRAAIITYMTSRFEERQDRSAEFAAVNADVRTVGQIRSAGSAFYGQSDEVSFVSEQVWGVLCSRIGTDSEWYKFSKPTN
jgi:hypothetical protein